MPPSGGSTKRRRGRATEAAAAEADALTSLPPEVLDDILTRLGIRDAVRTSALSRAWRRRWEALPSLDLYFRRPKDSESTSSSASPAQRLDLEDPGAVDIILLRFPGRVRRFSADLDSTYAGRIHDWLRVLSRRAVEILDLSFSGNLPSSVFSCSRLTDLRLSGCAIPLLPPGFVAFPDLKRLSLISVRLQEYGEEQLEEIIATSPLLEHLVLNDVVCSGANIREWVIRSPNLRQLSIWSENNDGWILKQLTSLNRACVNLSVFAVHPNFAKFLSGLVQVEELLVDMSSVPSSDMMPEILLCTFHNLKSLDLIMDFCKQAPIMLILCLLKNASNLEKLEITILGDWEEEFGQMGSF